MLFEGLRHTSCCRKGPLESVKLNVLYEEWRSDRVIIKLQAGIGNEALPQARL